MTTDDDDEVALDTHPMSSPLRLWSHWRAGSEVVSPDLTIWFVCDAGHFQVPATTEAHAYDLAEAMQFAEFMHTPMQPLRWLAWLRRGLLRVIRWTNRHDPRWLY